MPSAEYSTTYNRRGRALIINNVKFKAHPTRKNSDDDTVRLYSLFEEMGFDTEIHHNKSARDIINIARTVICSDHSEMAAIMIAILSYGTNQDVLGTDGSHLNIKRDVVPMLDGEVTLHGKPRIIVVQACSLNYTMTPVPARLVMNECLDDVDGQWMKPLSKVVSDSNVKAKPMVMKGYDELDDAAAASEPEIGSDCFIITSTLPASVPRRSNVPGSCFIGAMCDVLSSDIAGNTEVLQLFNRVTQRFYQRVHNEYGREEFPMPITKSTLKKKLHFT